MRLANVLVSLLGIAAAFVAALIAWRGRSARHLAAAPAVPESAGSAALDALHTLAVVTASGGVAGVLVPGLGGRLLMRVLGATSGDAAEGRLTEAEEVVGDVTAGGTIAFIVFVGLFGGLLGALLYLLLRRWLPSPAGAAGVVLGLLLLGTIGVLDPMSPENVDFAILSPTWLALAMIVTLALLFGVTFTALVARLDAWIPPVNRAGRGLVGYASLIVLALPPLIAVAAVYIAGRTVMRGRLRPLLDRAPVRLAAHVALGLALLLAVASSLRAIGDIAST